LRTLLRLGWLPRRYTNDASLLADVIIAHKSQGTYDPSQLTLPPDEAATWAAPEPGHRFTTAQSVMSCDQSSAVVAVEICLSNPAPLALAVTVTAGETTQQVQIPKHAQHMQIRIPASGWAGQITIGSSTWVPAQVYGTTDPRTLGVAIHWIRLLDQNS
jgi:hypothetical protein